MCSQLLAIVRKYKGKKQGSSDRLIRIMRSKSINNKKRIEFWVMMFLISQCQASRRNWKMNKWISMWVPLILVREKVIYRESLSQTLPNHSKSRQTAKLALGISPSFIRKLWRGLTKREEVKRYQSNIKFPSITNLESLTINYHSSHNS